MIGWLVGCLVGWLWLVGRFVVVFILVVAGAAAAAAVVLLLLLFLGESGYETTGWVLVAALSRGTSCDRHRHVDTAHFPSVRKQTLLFRMAKDRTEQRGESNFSCSFR